MGIGASLEIAREGGGGDGQLNENKGGYRDWGRRAPATSFDRQVLSYRRVIVVVSASTRNWKQE